MCGDAKRVNVAIVLFLEIIDQGRLVLNYRRYQLIYVNL